MDATIRKEIQIRTRVESMCAVQAPTARLLAAPRCQLPPAAHAATQRLPALPVVSTSVSRTFLASLSSTTTWRSGRTSSSIWWRAVKPRRRQRKTGWQSTGGGTPTTSSKTRRCGQRSCGGAWRRQRRAPGRRAQAARRRRSTKGWMRSPTKGWNTRQLCQRRQLQRWARAPRPCPWVRQAPTATWPRRQLGSSCPAMRGWLWRLPAAGSSPCPSARRWSKPLTPSSSSEAPFPTLPLLSSSPPVAHAPVPSCDCRFSHTASASAPPHHLFVHPH